MFNGLSKIKQFDDVTRFRLINAFIYAIGLNLITPIILDLKGEYLLAWVISIFMIVETLIVKTNNFVVNNFSLEQLYRIGIFVHLIVISIAATYFINPLFMIYGDSIAMIIQVAIFSAYSIKLNNYITKYFPNDMSNFQIIRNSIWADGMILGLIFITIILYFTNKEIGISIFLIYNILYILWMLYNWNFFKNIKE